MKNISNSPDGTGDDGFVEYALEMSGDGFL